MTKKEFLDQLESLIEEYTLENDEYEDIHECHDSGWRGIEESWNVNFDIVKHHNFAD